MQEGNKYVLKKVTEGMTDGEKGDLESLMSGEYGGMATNDSRGFFIAENDSTFYLVLSPASSFNEFLGQQPIFEIISYDPLIERFTLNEMDELPGSPLVNKLVSIVNQYYEDVDELIRISRVRIGQN